MDKQQRDMPAPYADALRMALILAVRAAARAAARPARHFSEDFQFNMKRSVILV